MRTLMCFLSRWIWVLALGFTVVDVGGGFGWMLWVVVLCACW
ncbi:hypothetical protein Poly41_59590 [Novipirellula artificiosorum]|uniref:Uncharacterized protein n=1 Tax=Novipirellula artificiosorum TaxID=2528016 RepID=A0A5C6D7B1_9BACT|nr:hypothetical protein Poly41_59590 [Novipirellula artificiosorum]